MGRGTGENSTATVATRGAVASTGPEYLSRREHWKTMPESIQWIGSTVVVPCRQYDEDGRRISEATRCCLGSDGDIYVLRQRDTYEKRLVGKNRLVAEETATVYKGKSLKSAANAMNADLAEFGDGPYNFSGIFHVAGGAVSPHSTDHPYRVGRLVEALEKLLDTPQNDRTKRVLDSFGLEI